MATGQTPYNGSEARIEPAVAMAAPHYWHHNRYRVVPHGFAHYEAPHEPVHQHPHGRNIGALKRHPKPVPPKQYAASLDEVHQAIHQAAAEVGISANLAGAIAHLESLYDKTRLNNATDGSSMGVFQMQEATSYGVMRAHREDIAAKLDAANKDGRYTDILSDLNAGKLPSKEHYNAVVLDPYFNSLLGCNLIRDNARDHGFSTANTKNLPEIYSMHLSGHLITPGDSTLTQLGIAQKNIDANTQVLGIARGSDPTATEAYQSISHFTTVHLNEFVADDKRLGLYKPDAPPPAPHKAHAAHGHGHAVRHAAAPHFQTLV